MNQLIAISAIGNDRTGLVYDLTRVIVDCGGNILESRMTALGNELRRSCWCPATGIRLPSSRANSPSWPKRPTHDQQPTHRSTAARTDMVSYSVDVVCLEPAGRAPLARRVLLVAWHRHRRHQHAQLQRCAHGRADVLRLYGVHVPTRIHIAALREEFLDLCDHLNLDAILEPLKA